MVQGALRPPRRLRVATTERLWSRLLVGAFLGCLVGLALYGASQIRGPGLFLLLGGVAGGAAATSVRRFSGRRVELSEVRLTIPQLSELRFVVGPDNRLVAWRIYVELTTRVSTQPLGKDEGTLREALTSLYSLFQGVRGSLREARPTPRPDSTTVEELGVSLLNVELRPFLSRWHVALQEWERHHKGESELTWERNEECRAALAELQQRLSSYVDGFARLAGTKPPTPRT
jgi:hypothetical protein